jgi:Phosphodiester glycosidase
LKNLFIVLILFVVVAACLMGFQNPVRDELMKLFKVQPQSAETQVKPESKSPDLQKQFFKLPPPPSESEMQKEVPGDSAPPEAHSMSEVVAMEKLFFRPPPLPSKRKMRTGVGKPLMVAKKKIGLVPFYQITVSLDDPDAYIVVRLPNNAKQANSTTFKGGDETFDRFVKQFPSAAMVNGTFFSKDDQERVMGNLVSDGKTLKYSRWENFGTTLSIGKDDKLEMVTAREEGKPTWDDKWFSLTCGPRLLKHGEVWLEPKLEGFTDPHVFGAGPRCAVGYPRAGNKLIFVNFMRGLTLDEEARLMKSLGCYEAMNLDGGASKALAQRQSVLVKPARPLTNVISIYDSVTKAPSYVVSGWKAFQEPAAKTSTLESN